MRSPTRRERPAAATHGPPGPDFESLFLNNRRETGAGLEMLGEVRDDEDERVRCWRRRGCWEQLGAYPSTLSLPQPPCASLGTYRVPLLLPSPSGLRQGHAKSLCRGSPGTKAPGQIRSRPGQPRLGPRSWGSPHCPVGLSHFLFSLAMWDLPGVGRMLSNKEVGGGIGCWFKIGALHMGPRSSGIQVSEVLSGLGSGPCCFLHGPIMGWKHNFPPTHVV